MGCKCGGYVTQGKAGEAGSWCVACGEKVWEVEARTCGECVHFMSHGPASVLGNCGRHLMVVTSSMLVTYRIDLGTCWRDKQDIPRGLMRAAQ